MKIRRITNLNENLKHIERITYKGELNLLHQYIRIKDKPIESIQDYEKLIKWHISAINHVKRQQRLIRYRIHELICSKDNSDSLSRCRRIYLLLEEDKSMFIKSSEILIKKLDLYRYEPEKLADPKVQFQINQEFIENIADGIEYINRDYNP